MTEYNSNGTVTHDVIDRIARVRYRPDKRNCMSPTLDVDALILAE